MQKQASNPADPHFKYSTVQIKHKLFTLLCTAVVKAEPGVESHRNMKCKKKSEG